VTVNRPSPNAFATEGNQSIRILYRRNSESLLKTIQLALNWRRLLSKYRS
jgi:hypothetical protein